jgi:hypothetical protein
MPVLTRTRRLLAGGTALALAASFVGVAAGSVAAAPLHPPLTVSKIVAHSGTDHGDQIDESGSGCTGEQTSSVIMYLAKGVVADSEPIDTDLTAFGYEAAPDDAGDWTGVYSVQGGGVGALPAGKYTLRTECELGITPLFIYAGVVITINGDAEVTTTTAAPTTTTTATTAVAPTTAAVAPTTTAAPAVAVAAQAALTG